MYTTRGYCILSFPYSMKFVSATICTDFENKRVISSRISNAKNQMEVIVPFRSKSFVCTNQLVHVYITLQIYIYLYHRRPGIVLEQNTVGIVCRGQRRSLANSSTDHSHVSFVVCVKLSCQVNLKMISYAMFVCVCVCVCRL